MTDRTNDPRQDDRIRDRLDAYFSTLGMGFNGYLERRARIDQMRALSERSDAELQAMGLDREGIAAYVFRDLFDS